MYPTPHFFTEIPIRFKELTRRILSSYLCVYFVFPSFVWAKPAETPKQTWNPERLALFQSFSLAAWKMAAFFKQREQAQKALQIRETDYQILFAPYDRCDSPWAKEPQSLESLDEKVLKPLEQELAAFLNAHVLEMGQVEMEIFDTAVSVPATRSDENASVCILELPTPSLDKVSSEEDLINATRTDLELVHQPLFRLLAGKVKSGGVVTNLETRRWISWLMGLRQMRQLVGRIDQAAAIAPPRFTIEVGKKLSQNYASARNALGAFGVLKDDLPRFEPCDTSQYCLVEPALSTLDQIREHILMKSTGAYSHGKGLDTLRRYSLMLKGIPERAVIDVALGRQAANLNLPACIGHAEQPLIEKYHRELVATATRSRWIVALGKAVDDLIQDYRQKKEGLPLPEIPSIFDEGNIIALGALQSYFVAQPQKNKDEIIAATSDLTFKDYAYNSRTHDEYADLLAGKMKLTLATIENDLISIPENSRQLFLKKEFETTLLFALSDLLQNYLLEIADLHGLETKSLLQIWQSNFQTQWQTILSEPVQREELSRMAELLSHHVLSRFQAPEIKLEDWSKKELLLYTQNLSGQARRASEADETFRFMESLAEWKNNAINLIPGSWTYYWNRAGIHFTPVRLKPENPDDYLHLKEALRLVAQEHREALVKRLITSGFTDENVRRQFGITGTDTLADLVLRRFSELVDASPTQGEDIILGKRREFLRPILAWLVTPDARSTFDSGRVALAKKIVDDLTPFLSVIVTNDSTDYASWKKQTDAILASISKTRTLAPVANADRLRELFESPERTQRALLTGLVSDVQASRLFDDFSTWKLECEMNKDKCSLLLTRIQEFLSRPLVELHAWRVVSHSTNYLSQFLNYFGTGGVPYQKATATAHPELVSSLKTRMVETWIGFDHAPDKTLLEALDALLEMISKQAHAAAPSDAIRFHQGLLRDWTTQIREVIKSTSAFLTWKTSIDSRVKAVATLHEDLGNEDAWKSVRTLALKELVLLEGASLSWLPSPMETQWVNELTLDFTTFRKEFTDAATVVLNNPSDPFKSLKEITQVLSTLALVETPSEALRQRISLLEEKRSKSERDIQLHTRLRLLLNYVRDLPIARDAKTFSDTENPMDLHWQTYVEDQHLTEIMPLFKDLNTLSLFARNEVSTNTESARKFLGNVSSYIDALLTKPQLLSLYYRETIRRLVHDLPEFALQHTFGNIPGPVVFREKLRIVFGRLARYLKTDGNNFEAFYKSFLSSRATSNLDRILELLLPASEVLSQLNASAKTLQTAKEAPTSYSALVTDGWELLLAAHSGFGPFWSSGKVYRIDAYPYDGFTPLVKDDRLESLKELLVLLGSSHRQTLASLAGLPEIPSDIEGYLNQLTISERDLLLRTATKEFERHLHGNGISGLSHLFRNDGTTSDSIPAFLADLERSVAYWETHTGLLKQKRSAPLRRTLVRCLFEHLSLIGYRLKDKHLVYAPDTETRLATLDDLSMTSDLSLAKDMVAVFRQESARPKPFEKALQSFEPKPLTAQSATILFYLRHLYGKEGVSFAFFPRPDLSVLPFWVHARPSDRTLSETFFTWFSVLLKDKEVQRQWARATTIASRYKSIREFSASQDYQKIVRVLSRLDQGPKGNPSPGTYPAFLAELNWALNHESRVPDMTAKAQPVPPSIEELNSLLTHLVSVLGLDLTRFNSWEALFDFKQGAPPDHWSLISRSLRDSISEIGQSGFLGTTINAPQARSPHTVFSNHGYIPFPVVDASERELYCTENNFAHWALSTETRLNPPHTQWLRFEREISVGQKSSLDNEIRGQKKYNLFHELASLETDEMVGLKDILEENPAFRGRFADRWDKWNEKPFGTRELQKDEIQTLDARLAKQKITTTSKELSRIHRIREALVDFRRTLNEINIQEGVNWQRESKNLFTGDLEGQLKQALAQFAQQMGTEGWEGKLATLRESNQGTFAEQRRNSIAQALFAATHMVHDTLYNGKSQTDVSRMRSLVRSLDTHYAQIAQSISVRRALLQVSENLDGTLNKLCQFDFSSLSTDKDFEARKQDILDSGLVFFDGHQEELFSSGWLPEQSQHTRSLLNQLSQELSDREKLMKKVEWGFNAVMVVSLVALVAGKSSPAFTHWVLATSARRTTALVAAALVTSLWIGIEANGIFDDFHAVPQALRQKIQIRDTQFGGGNAFLSPAAASALFDAIRKNNGDRISTFRWTFRVMAALAGFQMIRPWLRMALGGPGYLLRVVRHDWRGLSNRRLRFAGRVTGAGYNEPIAHLEHLSSAQAEERIFENYLRELGGTSEGLGIYRIDPVKAKHIAEDAKRQYTSLAKQLGLDPNDLGPLVDESVGILTKHALSAERARHLPRLRDLKYWAARFEHSTLFYQDEILEGVLSVTGTTSDIASRYVPLWLRILGVQYPTPTSLSLGRLQRLNRAQLDLISFYHPQVRFSLAKLSQAAGRHIGPWEIFAAPNIRALKTAPKEVALLVTEIFHAAQGTADRFLARAPYLYDSPVARLQLSKQFQREMIEATVLERGESVLSDELPESLVSRLKTVKRQYGAARVNLFCEQYLVEKGLSLPIQTREQLELLTKLVLWDTKYRDLIVSQIRVRNPKQNAVTESDIQNVLVAMIDSKHPKYTEFSGLKTKTEEWHFDIESTGTATFDPEEEIQKAAQELRDYLKEWTTDQRLLTAIAQGDYAKMTDALKARTVRSIMIPTEEGRGIDMPEETSEQVAREAPIVTQPSRQPTRQAPQPSRQPTQAPQPIDPAALRTERIESLQKGELPDRTQYQARRSHTVFDVMTIRVPGAQATSNHGMSRALSLVRSDLQKIVSNLWIENVRIEGIERGLGELRAAGEASRDTILAYRLASDHQRTIELIFQAKEAGKISSPEEAALLYEWCVTHYLGDSETVFQRPMSVFEAEPILGLNAHRSGYFPSQIESALKDALGKGIPEATAREAASAFLRAQNITGVSDMAAVLHFPEPYLDSPVLVTGLRHGHMTPNSEATAMLNKLYVYSPHESIEDARLVLGFTERADIQSVSRRASSMRAEIARRKSVSTNPQIHQTAIERIDLAEKILIAPKDAYPLKYIPPESFPEIPRVRDPERTFPEVTRVYEEHLNRFLESYDRYAKEIAQSHSAMESGQEALRSLLRSRVEAHFSDDFALLKIDLARGNLTYGAREHVFRQQFARLKHSRLIVEHARNTGCVISENEISRLFDTLMLSYVKREHVHFDMTLSDAEILIATAMKPLTTAETNNLSGLTSKELQRFFRSRTNLLKFSQDPEQLRVAWNALESERVLIAQGKGNISHKLHSELEKAIEIVKASYFPGISPESLGLPKAFGLYEFENLSLNSLSRLPLEVLVEPEILKNRRLVYLLLDSRIATKDSLGRSITSYAIPEAELRMEGDWFIDLFSSEGGAIVGNRSQDKVQNTAYEVFRRLRWNDALPKGDAKDLMEKILERALGRLNPGKDAPQAPALDPIGRIIDPTESTPVLKPSRLILPPG